MDVVYQILFGVTLVISVASGVCAATPTPDPNTAWGKVYRAIEFLGLLVGKAKEEGLIPPREP